MQLRPESVGEEPSMNNKDRNSVRAYVRMMPETRWDLPVTPAQLAEVKQKAMEVRVGIASAWSNAERIVQERETHRGRRDVVHARSAVPDLSLQPAERAAPVLRKLEATVDTTNQNSVGCRTVGAGIPDDSQKVTPPWWL